MLIAARQSTMSWLDPSWAPTPTRHGRPAAGRAAAVAGAEGAAAASRASRASRVLRSRDPVGHQHERHGVPSRSVAMPARLLTPVRVPVLARTRPRPGGGRRRTGTQRPGEAGDRQSGEDGPQVGVVVGGGDPEHVDQGVGASRFSRDSPLPSYTRAAGAGRRAGSGPEHRVGPAGERAARRVATPTWRASTSAASLSLTSSIRSTICGTGARSTPASGWRVGGRRRRVCRRPGSPRASACGERRRRRPRRVRRPARSPEARPSSTHSAVIGETTPSGT